MKCFNFAIFLAVAMVGVKSQYYGAAPFHNTVQTAESASAAHHDARGAYAESGAHGVLDAHHTEHHDREHDLADGYGLHEHDEEHHGLADGLHQQYAAHAAHGEHAVHDGAQQYHTALTASNAGHRGYGYIPSGYGLVGHGAFRHGLYGPGFAGHRLYGPGFAGHGLHGFGFAGHGFHGGLANGHLGHGFYGHY